MINQLLLMKQGLCFIHKGLEYPFSYTTMIIYHCFKNSLLMFKIVRLWAFYFNSVTKASKLSSQPCVQDFQLKTDVSAESQLHQDIQKGEQKNISAFHFLLRWP